MKRSERKNEDFLENSWGGYQYRWNYDEYQKDLQTQRRKYAVRGMRAFCLTAVFIFVLCFASLAGVLSVAFIRGSFLGRNGMNDKLSLENDGHTVSGDPLQGLLPVDTDDEGRYSEDTEEQPEQTVPESPETPEDTVSPIDTGAFTEPDTDLLPETDTGVETLDDDYAQKIMSDEIIAQKTYPSVVSLHFGDTTTHFAGNGFFLSEDGYLVTAYHILQTGIPCFVKTEAGHAYDAELISFDTAYDLALLKIEATGMSAVCLGSSEAVVPGDSVVAVERMFDADIAAAFASGHIFGKERIPVTDHDTADDNYKDVLCSTVRGEGYVSGSPLLNDESEVIGINVRTVTGDGDADVIYSIPIDPAAELLHDWMRAHRQTEGDGSSGEVNSDNTETDADTKTTTEILTEEPDQTEPVLEEDSTEALIPLVPVIRSDLGVLLEAVTNEEAALYKIPVGLLVCYMEPSSYAENNRLQRGDIILSVNGVAVHTVEDFDRCFSSVYVTDTVELVVFRRGSTQTLILVFDGESDAEAFSTECVSEGISEAA